MSIPLRLPCGVWWLAEEGILDQKLLFGEFETMERRFVKTLLRRDMNVVDVGAHHGIYTLLASKCVGWHGRVVAIEPSPRERLRLEKHLRLNRSSNVELIPCATIEDSGEAELYVAERFNDVCNSLRPPDTPEPVKTQQVQIRRLDDILSELDISRVDFIKLDAEGAELSVLYGATKLLNCSPRPAMLVEVQDIRTKPWGYAALHSAIPDAHGLSVVRNCSKRRAAADSVQPGNIRRKPGRASGRAHRRISEPARAKVRGFSEIPSWESRGRNSSHTWRELSSALKKRGECCYSPSGRLAT